MIQKLLSLLLAGALLLSLAGCKTKDPEPTTTAPTTEATEPPTTEAPKLTAQEYFSQAIEALKAESNVTMEFSAKETYNVWKDSYLCNTKGTAVYEDLQSDSPVIKVEGDVSYNRSASIPFTDFYFDNNSYAVFSYAQAKHRDESDLDTFLSRQYPICLFEADHFQESMVWDTPTGVRLTFSGATILEDWLAPDYAELIEASGELVIGEKGAESMSYTAKYRQGPSDISFSINTTLKAHEGATLTKAAPEDAETYALVDFALIPQMVFRAIYNYKASLDRSYQQIEMSVCQAAALGTYTVSTSDVSKDKGNTLLKTDVVGNIYSSAGSETQTYTATYRDGTLTEVIDGETSETKVTETRISQYVEGDLERYYPQLTWIRSAEMSLVGDGVLLEFGLDSKEAEKYYKNFTAEALLGDQAELLDQLATNYTTNKLTAYMGIDPDTWLPTSYGLEYEGVHTIEGTDCILSESYYSKLWGSDPESRTAITEEPVEDVEPEVPATPLFYHVTGQDGSEMWLLGTIHVGDSRTAYLPQEIYDAFDASDALAVEFNMNAYEEDMATDEDYQEDITDLYFYSDDSTIQDHLDEDVYEAALKYMKYTGEYNPNLDYFKPFVWESAITQFLTGSGRRLFSQKGVDQRLLDRAEEQEKEILDVESAESQMSMLSDFSEGLQQILLASAISSSRNEYNNSVLHLYELWCAGDEEALIQYLREEEVQEEEEEMDEETRKYLEEYTNAMSTDRDIDMVAMAKDYLRSGKTVFYAVGLAHLLEENGLVDSLRAAGYTVELVEFKN